MNVNSGLLKISVLAMGLLGAVIMRAQEGKTLLQAAEPAMTVKKIEGGIKQVRQLQESVDTGDFFQTPSGPRILRRLPGRFAVRGQGGKSAAELLAPHTAKGEPFVGYTQKDVGRNTIILTAPDSDKKTQKSDATSEMTVLRALRKAVGVRVDPIFIDPDSGLQRIVGTDIIVCLKPGVDAKTYFGDEWAHARPMPGAKGQFILTVDKASAEAVLEDCVRRSADERVEWAEPDFLGELVKHYTPNDTYFGSQWHLKGTGIGSVQAETAWDVAKGDDIVVAVVDDGVQTAHPDLAGNIFVNTGEIAGNGIDDDGNGYADDINGWNFVAGTANVNPAYPTDKHGTAVAGVAAAVGNNSLGVAGVAVRSKILPIKISANDSFINDSVIATAIRYAAGLTGAGWQGADIINCSWGGGAPNSTLDSALTAAATSGRNGKGCPIFVSSGNSARGYRFYDLSVSAGSHTLKIEYTKDGSAYDGLDRVWLDDVYLPGVGTEGFEGATFPPSGWSTGGNANWVQNADLLYVMGTGTKSACSGTIGNSQANFLQVTKTLSAGTITFWLWTSTEYQCDVVNIYLDGVKVMTHPGGVNVYTTGILYPASHVSTIAVGASTDYDYRADYSQFGTGLDFVAPSGGGASGIYTTDRTGTDGYSSSSYTSSFSGTSSASPLAAGIGALVLCKNPTLTASEVRAIMRKSCAKIGGVTYSGGDSGAGGWNTYNGYGRITASTAIANTPAVSTPPSAPSGVSASDDTYTDKVRVTWTASSGATSYKIYRSASNSSSSSSLLGTPSASPYDDTSAVGGTTYYYWVKASNSFGDSGYSSSDSGRMATPTVPSAPSGVNASDDTYTDKVRVTWTVSSGATSYKIYRSASNSSSSSSLLGTPSASPYDDTSAVAGTTYYYWVKASNSYGDSGYSSSDSGRMAIASKTLSSITVTGASTVMSGNTANFTCTATYSDSSTATVTPTWSLSSTTYATITSGGVLTAKTVSANQSVTVVASYTEGGLTSMDQKSVTIQPSTPTVPAAPTISISSQLLSWSAVSGASYYRVYRATTPFDTPTAITSWQTATQYALTDPPSGTIYYYWVKAAPTASDDYASAFSNMRYKTVDNVTIYTIGAEGGIISETEGGYFFQERLTYTPSLPLPSWVTPVLLVDTTEYTLDQTRVFTFNTVKTVYYRVTCAANSSSTMRMWSLTKKYEALSAGTTTLSEVRFYQAPGEASIPSAPIDVSAGDGSSTANVGISWTASSGATGYSVYRGTSSSSSSSSLLGSTSGTSYTDSTATPGTLYYYWVKASNGAGTSGFSSYNTGYRALSAPSGVSASDTASDAVTVSWSSVTGASYYRVYRATSSGGTKTALGSWQNALSYSDTSATAGTTYYYWVAAAVDSSGTRASAYSSYDTGIKIVVSSDYTYTISDGKVTITGYTGAGGAIAIPSTIAGYPVTSIGYQAFLWYSSLTSITIPNSITNVGGYAFYGCSGLTGITIPNSVISIGERAFALCSGLSSVTISSSVTSIGDFPFGECNHLTNILVSSSNPTYSSVEGVLFDKSRVRLIQYPQGKSESHYQIPDGVLYIAPDAFRACSRLTTIIIPNGVTSIGEFAFYQSGLTGITIPNSVSYIGTMTFARCFGLTTVIIPESVTSIDFQAFGDCANLTSAFFVGNSPWPGFSDSSMFYSSPTTVYYVSGTTGWSSTYGGRPTAVWTSAATFNGNGGTPSFASRTYNVGNAYGELPTATRSGYAFEGWWTGAGGTGSQVPPPTLVPYATTGHTLYAAWSAVQQQVATPSISPTNGTVFTTSSKWVTITCATEGAGIRFTTNGVDPTASSALYSGAFNIYATTTVKARAFMSGMADSVTAVAVITKPVFLTLADALDVPAWTITTGGDASWTPQTSETHDAADAARAGDIGASQTTWMESSVSGAGTLTFWWRASCEDSPDDDWDYLTFMVDGTEQERIDGDSGWRQVSVALPSGDHTLRWTYAKDDYDETVYEDCGWVDQVIWTPAGGSTTTEVPVPYTWLDQFSLVTGGNYEAAALADADGDGHLTWQEYVAGTVPTNAASVFTASIVLSNGYPFVSWTPDLGTERVYTVEGKSALTNAAWLSPTNSATRFFRVKVSMP